MKRFLPLLLLVILVFTVVGCGSNEPKEPVQTPDETNEAKVETEEPKQEETKAEEPKPEEPKEEAVQFVPKDKAQEEVVDLINTFFKKAKALDQDGYVETLQPELVAELKALQEQYGTTQEAAVNPHESFMKKNMEKISYQIKNITLEENEGWALIKVNYVNAKDYFVKVVEESMAALGSEEALAKNYTEEQKNEIRTKIGEKYASVEYPMVEKEIEIPLVLVDGKWYIKELVPGLDSAVTSGLSDVFQIQEPKQ